MYICDKLTFLRGLLKLCQGIHVVLCIWKQERWSVT